MNIKFQFRWRSVKFPPLQIGGVNLYKIDTILQGFAWNEEIYLLLTEFSLTRRNMTMI